MEVSKRSSDLNSIHRHLQSLDCKSSAQQDEILELQADLAVGRKAAGFHNRIQAIETTLFK
jgi:hypothetical protein